ncbi:MAG: hypothetical protein K2F79_00355 [Muribaculaceae bacterium]|nr:hypothetical protein [Muribaculaceae bacterium]
MIVAISIDKILDTVYAYSALAATRDPSAAVVGRDDAPALRRIARSLLDELLVSVGQGVIRVDDSDDDIITVEFDFDAADSRAGAIGRVLCSALCSGLASRVLPGDAALSEVASAERSVLLSHVPRIRHYRI